MNCVPGSRKARSIALIFARVKVPVELREVAAGDFKA
jgi:hypothetical protein